jgi:hypothetical protein
MREQLRYGRARERRMQPADVARDAVFEPQLPLLAQLHDARGSEALRMRGDAKQMPRPERRSLHGIGVPEGRLENDLVPVRDRHRAARLLVQPHLELEPARQVIDRWLQPVRHRQRKRCETRIALDLNPLGRDD